ncbi:MAG: glycoside hydrolase family 3 N-terminal domain-containing protein [Candidatus Tritonobacter lacicola]|nr:glycoside hydrolase family 3 N-terminal domain-containing protein [Candidatus Tritonobacter lacicola]
MMTEREAAALIMVGFEGTSLSPFLKKAVGEIGVGGVIFLQRNVESEEQLASVCREILALSPHEPPLLAIDQEGGRVCRVGRGRAVLPGNMALGASRSPDLAGRAGRMTALQIRDLGLNLVLAPVVDVISGPGNRVIGTRSYGDDPRMVAELGRACAEGIRDGGALSTAKHFPGLGRAGFDPHHATTPIDASQGELMRIDVRPFRETGTDFVMISHASYTRLDPFPATVSARVINGLLGSDPARDCAVISDDLCMKAISGRMSVEEAAVRFLGAGGDLVLICEGEETLEGVTRSVREAVGKGDIPRESIREKRGRLDAARGRVGGVSGGFSRREMEELCREIARASVTAVRVEPGLLPLEPGAGERIFIVETRYPGRSDGPSLFAGLLRGRHERTGSVLVGLSPSEEEIREAAGKSDGARYCIFLAHDCRHHARQLELSAAVAEKCGDLICIDTGTPYGLGGLERAAAVLATYSYSDASLEAAADVLSGKIAAEGTLPVKIRT